MVVQGSIQQTSFSFSHGTKPKKEPQSGVRSFDCKTSLLSQNRSNNNLAEKKNREFSFILRMDHYEWTASSPSDLLTLGVLNAFLYLAFHWIALQYAEHWSKPLQSNCSSNLSHHHQKPQEQHINAGILYVIQHAAGGIANWPLFAAALVSTPVLVPHSYQRITTNINISSVLWLIASTDFVLYLFHYAAHKVHCIKRWSQHTTAHHQTIAPTAATAAAASLQESLLLVWVAPIVAMNVLGLFMDDINFTDSAIALLVFEWHLTAIHSHVSFVYEEPVLRRLGIVTTHDHYVHHVRQDKNLGHVFVIWDLLFGTYLSYRNLIRAKSTRRW